MGRKPGLYDKWSDAQAQVNRFAGACHKGYDNRQDAEVVFNSYLQQSVAQPLQTKPKISTSNLSSSSTDELFKSRKLAKLVKEQSDLAREIASNSTKMEKLSEQIRKMLLKMQDNVEE